MTREETIKEDVRREMVASVRIGRTDELGFIEEAMKELL
jgi:hypothetical protein